VILDKLKLTHQSFCPLLYSKSTRYKTIHEAPCDFVPPGVLRNEIQKLNEALMFNSTTFERIKAEKNEVAAKAEQHSEVQRSVDGKLDKW
jgi:hypothetical protein